MKLLLHACCGVCLPGPLDDLASAGQDVTVFFYTPNIQPLLEFRKRLKAVEVLQQRLHFPAVYDETYDLNLFFSTVTPDLSHRCRACYRLRLTETARRAAEMGAESFATTLATSSHQNHELLLEEGRRAADDFNVEFLYRDWRPLHDQGVAFARKSSLYRQQYCGCVWSEEERYRDTSRELFSEDRRLP